MLRINTCIYIYNILYIFDINIFIYRYIDVHTKTYALQKRLLSRCRNNNIYLKIYLYTIY